MSGVSRTTTRDGRGARTLARSSRATTTWEGAR